MCCTLAECFNGWIKEERFMSVTAMLYHIRRKMMKMFDDCCRECLSWRSELCPLMESIYRAKVDVARFFRVVISNEVEFEVEDVIVHYVNVERKSCSCHCRYWQIDGFPCVHAVASIISSGGSLYSFINLAFAVSSFSQSYSQSIHPIANIEMPENCDIMPPDVSRGPERPKKKRIESTGASWRRIH
ncbi:hypothetical protein IFM89_005954 [Coptis chinensis]|uniref:SWIM-type domain-containing protein n=1 Tax=Coptis chinensis TaxID=261450 RepID=A0A835IC80_9MAGN|nr:hypothetical protein IFM89_005954 [Coptis chinensis]